MPNPAPAVNAPPALDCIPQELKGKPNWVCWREEPCKGTGELTKPPINPHTGHYASPTDPDTWGTLQEALEARKRLRLPGIGFVLTKDSGIVAIDLDHCRNPETGDLTPMAQRTVERLKSYTEVSPSGEGLHIFVSGSLPPDGKCRIKDIELYDSARYLTVTGHRIESTPAFLEERQDAVDALHGWISGDAALVEAAKADDPLFAALWDGDRSQYEGDDSAADLALCNKLAPLCGRDPVQMDRIFRWSALMRPKWDEPRGSRTYGQMTIDRALDGEALEPKAAAERPLKNPSTASKRPEIVISNRQLRDMTYDAIEALITANDPPQLFARAGEIVRLAISETSGPRIEVVSDAIMLNRLTAVADFFSLTRYGPVGAMPPVGLAKNIIADGGWPFPTLEYIVQVPVLRTDGSILDNPGYDEASKLYYSPGPGLVVSAVPGNPTPEDVKAALELVMEAVGDFPYDNVSSRANALALLLTPLVRPVIDGAVPLALLDAPQQGTGKSLFASIVALVGTGRDAAMMAAPDNDEEWRKRITATLYAGATIIIIDNIEGRLDSASLASAITATTWKDRVLGHSKVVELRQRATWMATGNNLRLGGDIQRRCYSIRLDAKMATPWRGRQFKHPNLREWVTENRGKLIGALLTMVRAWYCAGCPQREERGLGSFEVWSRVVGGVLDNAQVDGFLAGC